MSVLTLHIRPEGAQQYLARVFDGKILVGIPTLHPGIKEAIEAYGLGQGFAGVIAFHIWYGGWSVGTIPLDRMRTEAAELANRLVVLSAVVREVHAQLCCRLVGGIARGVKQNEINRNCVETPSTGSVGTIRVMFNTVHERTAP